eukprot:CAMPEP_0184693458 /NCGR_PEP_ID=MMETSP0313-20130426/1674_1 /TAXON_ID=2792 /ORGANISM="Porphyridium aerugineum, Strain SAG 1380-2" /LENGTH=468 /DNA_ID=CAMNT_0027151541 /DNA_START=310 /DNA_END=1716 /DNA_ORIENTATION=-
MDPLQIQRLRELYEHLYKVSGEGGNVTWNTDLGGGTAAQAETAEQDVVPELGETSKEQGKEISDQQQQQQQQHLEEHRNDASLPNAQDHEQYKQAVEEIITSFSSLMQRSFKRDKPDELLFVDYKRGMGLAKQQADSALKELSRERQKEREELLKRERWKTEIGARLAALHEEVQNLKATNKELVRLTERAQAETAEWRRKGETALSECDALRLRAEHGEKIENAWIQERERAAKLQIKLAEITERYEKAMVLLYTFEGSNTIIGDLAVRGSAMPPAPVMTIAGSTTTSAAPTSTSSTNASTVTPSTSHDPANVNATSGTPPQASTSVPSTSALPVNKHVQLPALQSDLVLRMRNRLGRTESDLHDTKQKLSQKEAQIASLESEVSRLQQAVSSLEEKQEYLGQLSRERESALEEEYTHVKQVNTGMSRWIMELQAGGSDVEVGIVPMSAVESGSEVSNLDPGSGGQR